MTDTAGGGAGGEDLRPQKRSFSIRGHRTSVSLEAPFWDALKEAASQEGRSLAALVAEIDAGRGAANLSSAIRVFLLARWRNRAAGPRSAPDHA